LPHLPGLLFACLLAATIAIEDYLAAISIKLARL
jgi:hypothetical protein